MYFYGSVRNIISGNIALDNKYGIVISWGSAENNIWKNTIKDNTEEGIRISSHYNNLFQNFINNSKIGLNMHPTQYSTI